jgi:hypothetical protein
VVLERQPVREEPTTKKLRTLQNLWLFQPHCTTFLWLPNSVLPQIIFTLKHLKRFAIYIIFVSC